MLWRLASALLAVLLAAARGTAVAAAKPPLVQFWGPGLELTKLPGADILNPPFLVNTINITMVAANIEGPAGGKTMLQFQSSLYQSEAGTFLHGPTLRLRAGEPYTINLVNNLPMDNPRARATVSGTGFAAPTHTNLHAHGLHDDPGLKRQTGPITYRGGDNMFVKVMPAGGKLSYRSRLPDDHLPGLHWYHPHFHGSTTLQTLSANGVIVVEDDPRWLPNANGCAAVKAAMAGAQDVIMHMELLTFAPPNPNNDTATAAFYEVVGPVKASLDDTNIQDASAFSSPQNPLCCNGRQGRGVGGTHSNKDILLVNGGWLPRHTMEAKQWQRWRLVHTGYKRFLSLQIVDSRGVLARSCQMALLSKDGIYVPRMPRQVNHIFLTSGNRAELLVRCAQPGTYTLTAGRRPSPFGLGFDSLSWFQQSTVMTLVVRRTTRLAAPSFPDRGCQPLFPSYATDLSDATLRKANAMRSMVRMELGFGTAEGYGCLVNGENFTFPDKAPITMPLGKVVQWDFTGLQKHPVHLHTVPFYIADLPQEALKLDNTYTTWFEVGDRMDTLQLPMIANGNPVPLRIQPGPFPGYSVMHCHFLNHEDEGCMKVVKWECPGFTVPQPAECAAYRPPVVGAFEQTVRRG